MTVTTSSKILNRQRSLKYGFVVVFFLMWVFLLPLWGMYSWISAPQETISSAKKLVWAIDFQLGELKEPTIRQRQAAVAKAWGIFSQKDFPQSLDDIRWCLISWYGAVQKLQGKTCITGSGVTLLNNGHLMFSQPGKAPLETSELAQCMDQLERLHQFLAARNIPLLFVVFPTKIHCLDPQLPRGTNNADNEMADFCIAQAKQHGIRCFDVREMLKTDSAEHYRLFFRGDHHWKSEYAFGAFQNLAALLNQDFGISISEVPLASDSYSLRQDPFAFREQGLTRKVGQYYCDLQEDLTRTHYFPKFDTDLSLCLSLDQPQSEWLRGCFSQIPVSDYDDDTGFKKVVNHQVPNTKVILIKDSFARQWFDFFAFSVHETAMFDLRSKHPPISDYIDQNRPDIVIVGYYAGHYEPRCFNFFEPY